MEWPAHLPLVGVGCVNVVSEHKLVIEPILMKTCVMHNLHYWKPCIFKLKVHTYQVIQSIKQLIFLANTTLCQEEDIEVVLGESF